MGHSTPDNQQVLTNSRAASGYRGNSRSHRSVEMIGVHREKPEMRSSSISSWNEIQLGDKWSSCLRVCNRGSALPAILGFTHKIQVGADLEDSTRVVHCTLSLVHAHCTPLLKWESCAPACATPTVWSDALTHSRDRQQPKAKFPWSKLPRCMTKTCAHISLNVSTPRSFRCLPSFALSVSCFLASSANSKQESFLNDGIKR